MTAPSTRLPLLSFLTDIIRMRQRGVYGRLHDPYANKPVTSSNMSGLFGKQSMKDLCGLCGKKHDPTVPSPPPPPPPPLPPPPPPVEEFTEVVYGQTTSGITVANGGMKRFKTTVQASAYQKTVTATYTTGSVNIYMSTTTTKPAHGENPGAICQGDGTGGTAYCAFGNGLAVTTTLYVWVDGASGGIDSVFDLSFSEID